MTALPFRALATVVGCLATSLVAGGLLGPASAASAPIRVATMGDFDSNGVDNRLWADAVHARFSAANARGGVLDGRNQRHEVEVVECNTASDPEQTVKCAQQAVDQQVAAVVGMSVVYADRALQILEAARIPAIGVRVNAPSQAANPSSFPIASGTAAELAAMPQLLAQRGATKIAVIISDFGAATDELLTFIRRGLALTNAVAGPIVRIPPATTDFAAAVGSAIQPGVDGIAGFVAGGRARALSQELRASNYTGKYVTRARWGNAATASDPDTSLDGTLIVGQFAPPTSKVKGWQQFRRDMLAYDLYALEFNDGAINYWLAARVFERLVRGLDVDRIDPRTVDDLLDNKRRDTGGLTPPLARAKAGSELPRLLNRSVTFGEMRNGQVRLVAPKFFDPFRGQYSHRVE